MMFCVAFGDDCLDVIVSGGSIVYTLMEVGVTLGVCGVRDLL